LHSLVNVTVSGTFGPADVEPAIAVSSDPSCALASIMAVVPAQIMDNGTVAFAPLMNFTSVPASNTPLYVCYSQFGSAGPFVASSVGLLNVTAPTLTLMSPNTSVVACTLPNVTIAGTFCTGAPNATIAFSADAACALNGLMAVTKAAVTQNGQMVALNVNLTSVTSATQLYVCYSPSGPAGPFYQSDSTLLTMTPSNVTGITPSVAAAACMYALWTVAPLYIIDGR
jgi:hypothetical protein